MKVNQDVESAGETLAWARIDLDFDTGEALIEGIQTEWCRVAKRALRHVRLCKRDRCPPPRHLWCEGKSEDIERYVPVVL